MAKLLLHGAGLVLLSTMVPMRPGSAPVGMPGELPLRFEPCFQGDCRFRGRGPGFTMSLSSTGAALAPTIRMELSGANPEAAVAGLDKLPGKTHYFVGKDARNWRSNLPNYARVLYKGVYPGIDVVYYGNRRQLEYDFIVAPGADPAAIQLDFPGESRVEMDARGDLLVQAGAEKIRMRKPVAYQEASGRRRPVAGAYVMRGADRVGFEVGPYDAAKPLVIDPVLSYSTYVGGSGAEQTTGIAVDAAGHAYVTGTSNSDVFVAKLDPTGSQVVYSAYLGGSDFDIGRGIVVDSTGSVYVTGSTNSTDFPMANAVQNTLACGSSAFVAKLSPDGSALVYSTYLGGSGGSEGAAIAADSEGNAYIAGSAGPGFPTASALQPDYGGDLLDAFVAKLNPAGSALLYSTYLGGAAQERASGIAVDSFGHAYVAGTTSSTNFPATPGRFRDGGGCFVTKLTTTGASLEYSVLLNKGSCTGIAVDSSGQAHVTGVTNSPAWPTASPLQPAIGGAVLLRNTVEAMAWTASDRGLRATAVTALVVDPVVHSRLWAGASDGVFVSADGGASWIPTSLTAAVTHLVLDPAAEPLRPAPPRARGQARPVSALYAATAAGVFKSIDGGARWSSTSLTQPVSSLAVAATTPSTLLAGGTDESDRGVVFRSSDGGRTWRLSVLSSGSRGVRAVIADPVNPLVAYAGDFADGVFKSGDGGANWTRIGFAPYSGAHYDVSTLAIDPTSPWTLYAGVWLSDETGYWPLGVFKSTDGGSEWFFAGLERYAVTALIMDADSPSTVYAAAAFMPERGMLVPGGVFRSADGGFNWHSAGLGNSTVNALVRIPGPPHTLYAALSAASDAFVAKLNPAGSELVYSTFLGGAANDSGSAIALDAEGNAYVSGKTRSADFPSADAVQAGWRACDDAFVAKLGPTGGRLHYSTYLGGSGPDAASAIAVDLSGNAYVTGSTRSTDFPMASRRPPAPEGSFVAKISP